MQHSTLTLEEAQQPLHIHRLWAKYDRGANTYHLLIYHLLDVAAVAASMWGLALSLAAKAHMQKLLGLDKSSARQQLTLLAGLHDIGKATSAFQNLDDTRHGAQSAAILSSWLEAKSVDPIRASQLAAAIGGHHGHWVSAHEMRRARVGDESWRKLQRAICDVLQRTLDVRTIALPSQVKDFNVFAEFLSGFISICDWIGSDPDYFPYEKREIDLDAYYTQALVRAQDALQELGWLGWSPDGCEPTFESLFAFPPNALQRAVIERVQGLQKKPVFILIEYPTGSGKTETALYTGDLLLNRFGLSGIGDAMPTQATSNQMHGRVRECLERRYPESDIKARLVHAQAELARHFQAPLLEGQGEGDESGMEAKDWFATRKRALLAPFVVGTIDQALLSVLPVKHHFVRLFGLSFTVVILDEIHSYDVYMSVIIERQIQWLVALGSPIILLSATLSRSQRDKLLRAAGASCEDIPNVRYPRMTEVDHERNVEVYELPLPEPRVIRIRQIPSDISSLQREVLDHYRQGGCIAVVCNTVDESIDIARALRATEGIEADDVQLFHARYPAVRRDEIEDRVLRAFAKDGQRPERGILVATQIIEQSLDVDFDLMISRTAPIDFLIQRIGRLQRHPGRERPAHLAEPTLIWRVPEMNDEGMPDFGIDEAIYAPYILQKTWLRLRKMKELRTPDDIDELVNFVYDQNGDVEGITEDQRAALRAALAQMEQDNASSEFCSRQHVIGPPADELLLSDHGFRWPDEATRQALTRDIPPGIDIVCLIDEPLKQMAQDKPSLAETAILLQHKLTIRNRGVMRALEALPDHKPWAKLPQLKYARPLVFEDGQCQLPDSRYSLRLTRDYGLEIIKGEAACSSHST